MSHTTPIRVGLIGLGTTTNRVAPGTWASTAHLPAILSSPHYQLVALCNSTISSAQASIKHHNLPSSVRAYGSPSDLAADPNVDLIVCSVTVGKHFMLTKPAVLAGKDVYVEWPLGATTAEADELTRLAKEKGIKTVVGVQARADPLVVKIKELVDSGRIGKVVSSTVVGAFVGLPPKWHEGAAYYLDANSGGNSLTIYFGHFLDSFVHILGTFTSLNSILKRDDVTVTLVNSAGEVTNPAYPKTSPDSIFVQGTLASGALASITFRSPQGKTVSGTGVRWTITGTEGEIEVTSPETSWQYGVPGAKIRILVGDGEVEDVDFRDPKEPQYVASVTVPGTNVSRVYEAFATDDKGRFQSFEQALEVQKLLDSIKKGSL